MEKYDIIVIGAGPAGLSFATNIKDKNVLVVDKKRELGFPIKSSAATFTDTLVEFDLKRVVCHSSNGFRILLDYGFVKEFLYEEPVLHTLNFKKMIDILEERAKNNCELSYPSRIREVKYKNSRIEEIKTEKEVFKADVFVDASGESRVLLKHLDPLYYKKQWLVYGLEYETSNLDLNSNYFDFYFGNALMPEGYCWVFPTSKNSARIGLGKLIPGKGGNKKIILKNALKDFINSNVITISNFEEENIKEIHKGVMTYYKPLKKTYFDNCFVIGDAASHSSCLLGEGIRFSLKSGKALALALNSFDLDFAKTYFQHYINDMTKLFSYFPILLQIMKHFPNWGIRGLVKALSDYNKEDMVRILRSEFRKSDFLRLIYTFPKNVLT